MIIKIGGTQKRICYNQGEDPGDHSYYYARNHEMDWDTPYFDDENAGVPSRVKEGKKQGDFIPNIQNKSALGTCQISRHRRSDEPGC